MSDHVPPTREEYRLMLAEAREAARLREFRERVIKADRDIEKTLGKALGYPRYKDDPANFPGVVDDSVFVGEHTALTLVDEAAAEIVRLRELLRCRAKGPHHGDTCDGGRVHCPNAQFTEMCRECGGSGYTDAARLREENTKMREEVARLSRENYELREGTI